MARVSLAALQALVLATFVSALQAAPAIFPSPLHITRQVRDPISEKTTVLHEYGVGNRLVSVNGSRTAIADYEKGELIEIDRDAGTYSITRFESVAKAPAAMRGPQGGIAAKAAPRLRAVPTSSTKSGRTAEFFAGDLEDTGVKQTITVGVDRNVRVSKAALEVLLGAAYPGVRRPEHELMFSAAAPSGRLNASSNATEGGEPTYALPIEQTIEYEIDGGKLEFRSSVLSVTNEPPPADVVSIPAGARLVDSRITAVNRELEILERTTPLQQTP